MSNETGALAVPLDEALRVAEERVAALEIERDKARLELQRLRERSSVELAEARVAEARLQRAGLHLASKADHLQGEVNHLTLQVVHYRDANRELLQALRRLVEAHTEPETSEA